MRLPRVEECKDDPFLFRLRDNDERQFLSPIKGANQRFQARRRILSAIDLLEKHLPPPPLKIADIACGTADFGLTMAERGYEVDLVDREPKFFDYIQMKHTHGMIRPVKSDLSSLPASQKYSAIFFGEAIEHMAEPVQALSKLREHLVTGGLLCLTTPNGDFVDCYEENWTTVKNQKERNLKMANTLGNHVCEFTRKELKDLVKESGFSVLHHEPIVSGWIAKRHLLRHALPESWVWKWDRFSSRRIANPAGKVWGKLQILLAQRVD